MTERPHPDMDRVRDALRERDESLPEDEDAPPPEPEQDEPAEDDGDA